MVRSPMSAALVFSSCVAISATTALAQEPAKDPGHDQRKPKIFAIIFNMGYADEQGRDALVLANHNAYIPQPVKMKLKDAGKMIELFHRETKAWKSLTPTDGVVSFDITPGSFQLVHAK